MLNPKIAILGYKDFIDLTKGIIKNLTQHVSVEVYQCFHEETLHVLPELEKNQTDIIITGRANKAYLEDKTNIPIITFRITAIDILSAIKKALMHSKQIAIAMANFEELEYDFTILQDLLSIELTFISYSTQNELMQKVREFASTNGSVVGTSIAVNCAKELGLNGILIYSLENTIKESINHAVEMIKFRRKEEKKRIEFTAIINSVNDGILVTDEKDKITLLNKSAQTFLHLSESHLIGQPLSAVLPSAMFETLSRQEEKQDHIVSFHTNVLNVHHTPVIVKGQKLGRVTILQDISKIQKIEQKYRSEIEASGLIAKSNFSDIVFTSEIMAKTIEKAKKFSRTDSTILIIGETGTGKELFSQSIHNYSSRKNNPFVAVNCAALPESLLESELFGYEAGAFTGADKKGKKGLFELAHNGTIFLDEINSVSLQFQKKLLRVIQEKEVVRIGGDRVLPINIRIIASSNEDLGNLVEKKQFRRDLYYRLNVLKLYIPPLRHRKEDVVPLSKQFIYKYDASLYSLLEKQIEQMCEVLLSHDFKGNIRELHNILERFIVLCDREQVNDVTYCKELLLELTDRPHEEPEKESQTVSIPLKETYKESMFEAEKRILLKYLELYKGDKSTLSNMLGIGRTTLYRKLKDLGIDSYNYRIHFG